MSKLTTSSKRSPCPVCSDTTGKCRDNHEGLLMCMTLGGSQKGETANGFKCIGHSQDSLWALFVEDNGDWQPDCPYTPPLPRKGRPKLVSGEMEASERDRHNRAILKQLNLDPCDRADLHRRGFTDEEIAQGGFKSVRPWQPLKGKFPKNLPGLGKRGTQLCVSLNGYLCPVRDWLGRIVGFQVRARRSEGGRYRWVSREGASPHIDGELPLAIFKPPGTPTHIALIEGTGAKPLHTARRRGAIAIGAAGGLWDRSPQYLWNALQQIKAQYSDLPIRIYPDAGSLDNRGVMSRIKALIELLHQWECQLTVAWWKQFAKEDGDIDEIPLIAEISDLSPEDFLKLESSTRLQRVQDADWLEWTRLRSLTAAETIDKQFFEYRDPRSGEILAAVSGLGSGKTQWYLNKLKSYNERGTGGIIVSNRNSLLLDIIGRARAMGLPAYHYQSDIKSDPMLKGMQGSSSSIVAMCPDSFLGLELEDFEGKLLIIDEAKSVQQHTLTSSTHVGKHRAKILERFRQGIRRARSVILADGLLDDAAVNWYSQLAGKPVTVVKNNRQTPKIIKVIEATISQSGKALIGSADGAISSVSALPNSAKIAVVCDSQILAESLDRILSAQGRKVVRVDSKTSSTERIRGFLNDSTAFIEREKPDVTILTPTVEAGFDIKIRNYFTHLFGIYRGVVRPLSIVQQFERFRDPNIERILFVPPQGLTNFKISPAVRLYSQMPWLPKLGEKAAQDIKQAAREYLEQSFISGDGIPDKLVQDFIGDALRDDYEPVLQELQCELFERANLRQCVLYLLRKHQLEFVRESNSMNEKLWRDTNKAVKLQNSKDFFNAPSTTWEQREELRAKAQENGGLTWESRCIMTKGRIEDALPEIASYQEPVIFNPETQQLDPVWRPEFFQLTQYDDRAYLSKAKTRYGLENPQKVKEWEQLHWKHRLAAFADGESENFDLARYKSLWAKIRTLQKIGIEKFLQPNFIWSKDSPEVAAVWEACKPIAIQRNLGVKRGSEPMALVGRLIKSLGLKSTCKRFKEQGESKRYYSIAPESRNNPIIQAVLDCLERKFSDLPPTDEVIDTVAQTATASSVEIVEQSDTLPQVEQPEEEGLALLQQLENRSFVAQTFESFYEAITPKIEAIAEKLEDTAQALFLQRYVVILGQIASELDPAPT